MRSRVVGAVVLFVSFCAVAQPVYAEQNTGSLVISKLFRGLTNAVTGWMEIPKQMILTSQSSDVGAGLTWGFVKGIGYAVARSVTGGYEIATFPIPVPEGYRVIMEPEFVLTDMPH